MGRRPRMMLTSFSPAGTGSSHPANRSKGKRPSRDYFCQKRAAGGPRRFTRAKSRYNLHKAQVAAGLAERGTGEKPDSGRRLCWIVTLRIIVTHPRCSAHTEDSVFRPSVPLPAQTHIAHGNQR